MATPYPVTVIRNTARRRRRKRAAPIAASATTGSRISSSGCWNSTRLSGSGAWLSATGATRAISTTSIVPSV